MSQLFASGGQRIGVSASASFLPVLISFRIDWFEFFFFFFFFFSSTSLLLPTRDPPPSCTHAQSCNPMDGSQPGSSVHGLFQARILEWVAISFSIEFFLFREFGTREASVTCWLRVYALGTERIGVQFSFCHWLCVQPPTGVSLLGVFICDVRTEMVPRRLWWECSLNNSDSLAVVGLAEMILVRGLAQCLAHDVVYSLSHVWLFFDPIDCSPLGSSVQGISQARIVEWVAIFFSRESSRPGDRTCVSCIGQQILYHWATRKAPLTHSTHQIKYSFCYCYYYHYCCWV